jgi:hypothetical protein
VLAVSDLLADGRERIEETALEGAVEALGRAGLAALAPASV